MSSENMLFQKPVSVLAGAMEKHSFGPDAVIVIKVAQNGFKIRVMDENFVALTIEEAEEIVSGQLAKLVKNLKKNDKA